MNRAPVSLEPAAAHHSTARAGGAGPPGLAAPPDAAGAPADPLAPDELHVFVSGLDPLAASVACALVAAGVCLVNVADPTPVSPRDIRHGPYPAEAEGQPRELALRGLLRRRAPRCVPLTAPELFPSAAMPGAVVLEAWSVAGDLVADLTVPTPPTLDAGLPTLTVVGDGASVLRWPLTDWGHRPCAACVTHGVRAARDVARPDRALQDCPFPVSGDSPTAAVTRTAAVGELAALLLSLGLDPSPGRGENADHGGGGCGEGGAGHGSSGRQVQGPRAGEVRVDPGEVGREPHGGPVLRRGLHTWLLPANPGCLCSLAFEGT
ncbi:hypothetical protein [Kocuria sp.]|uniref:hypothetical protein n=1 Tax=Kocuria sp. TaxID=1871328 RepID=UPI0026DB1F9F|nr:hypothetical protein [Kocuria sp.]MDO4918896.1 hypothetical protein [Kocuria sp.]